MWHLVEDSLTLLVALPWLISQHTLGAMKCLGHLRFLVLTQCLVSALSMFHKRSKGYSKEELSPSKRLRANLEDLFLSNEVSALRAREAFEDAEAAGLPGFSRLARAGASGSRTSHAHRDLMAACLRNSKWPKPYYADVRVWNYHLQAEVLCKIPILLPHELLRVINQRSTRDAMLSTAGLSSEAKTHLQEVAAKTGVQELVALGLWLDATPCNWDRSESIESICLSLPGLSGQQAALRLPLCAVLKRHLVKQHTQDDLLKVVSWSLGCCLSGVMPRQRHDNTPWRNTDSKRAKLQGKPIGVQAICCEVRADWACLKTTFRMPGWKETNNCCFRCKVGADGIRDTSSTAPWRSPAMRHDNWSLFDDMLDKGRGISTIFEAPFVSHKIFVIDWLHCADLGVAQDCLANIFIELLPHMHGNNQDARVASLYTRIQQSYVRNQTESKLDTLTMSMLRKTASSAPKLRSKAAESRGLVPIAKEIAEEVLSSLDPVQNAVKQIAILLNKCYEQLSPAVFHSPTLQESCRKLCGLYIGLGDHYDNGFSFRFKPKWHLFQELCEMSGDLCPSTAWTYRDEDFGGSLAKLARRRGGLNSAATSGHLVLQKFCARHTVPALV